MLSSSAVVVLRAVSTDFSWGRDCRKFPPPKGYRHPIRAYLWGIYMRRKSCKLAFLTWFGYMLQIFLIALSALWVDIGVFVST
jgi:hypothetical protein